MFCKFLLRIWSKKLRIAKIDREVRLKVLANEQAHNTTLMTLGPDCIRRPSVEYRDRFAYEFDCACKRLGL